MNSSKFRIRYREGPQRLRKQSTSKLVKLKQKPTKAQCHKRTIHIPKNFMNLTCLHTHILEASTAPENDAGATEPGV